MSELVRFSVTMPADLMESLDEYTSRRGTSKNRSEAIRDLVRDALIDETIQDPEAQVFATLTMVFDHHANDLRDKLDDIQHAHVTEIVSSVHVHVDAHRCLEVIIMKGENKVVNGIADALLGTKGVLHGKLVVTAVEASDHGAHDHSRGQAHSHPHGHSHQGDGEGQ